MSRKLTSIAIVIGATLFCLKLGSAAAANPDLSGSWQMDADKSHIGDGRTMSLVIVEHADSIKLDGVVLGKDGNKTELHMDCKVDGGTDCVLNEGSHKSKVAIWAVSGVLTICKTEGPAGDSASEWHMKLAPDVKTMNVEVEHVDPVAPLETAVFSKKAAE